MRKAVCCSILLSLVSPDTLEDMLQLPPEWRTCQGKANPDGYVTIRAYVKQPSKREMRERNMDGLLEWNEIDHTRYDSELVSVD